MGSLFNSHFKNSPKGAAFSPFWQGLKLLKKKHLAASSIPRRTPEKALPDVDEFGGVSDDQQLDDACEQRARAAETTRLNWAAANLVRPSRKTSALVTSKIVNPSRISVRLKTETANLVRPTNLLKRRCMLVKSEAASMTQPAARGAVRLMKESSSDSAIVEDAAPESMAHKMVRYDRCHHSFFFTSIGTHKLRFQTTVRAANGSESDAAKITRLCFDKIVAGCTKEEALRYRDKLCRYARAGFPGEGPGRGVKSTPKCSIRWRPRLKLSSLPLRSGPLLIPTRRISCKKGFISPLKLRSRTPPRRRSCQASCEASRAELEKITPRSPRRRSRTPCRRSAVETNTSRLEMTPPSLQKRRKGKQDNSSHFASTTVVSDDEDSPGEQGAFNKKPSVVRRKEAVSGSQGQGLDITTIMSDESDDEAVAII